MKHLHLLLKYCEHTGFILCTNSIENNHDLKHNLYKYNPNIENSENWVIKRSLKSARMQASSLRTYIASYLDRSCDFVSNCFTNFLERIFCSINPSRFSNEVTST